MDLIPLETAKELGLPQGIYAEAALRGLEESCPEHLSRMREAGTLTPYLSRVQEQAARAVSTLATEIRKNLLSQSRDQGFLSRARAENQAMAQAREIVFARLAIPEAGPAPDPDRMFRDLAPAEER